MREVMPPPVVREPVAHTAQTLLPPVLHLLSAPQAVVAPVPSQNLPFWHASHPLRVLLSPPVVYEPVRHVLQVLAPTVLYMLSASHAVLALPPGQWYPAGHSVHAVRVAAVPPVVKEPAGHVVQLAAFAALYRLSPAHAASMWPPLLHEYPGRHSVHSVRSSSAAREVCEPGEHVSQMLLPAALYLLSAPHGCFTLPPTQNCPAGHGVHDLRVVELEPPDVKLPAGHSLHPVLNGSL